LVIALKAPTLVALTHSDTTGSAICATRSKPEKKKPLVYAEFAILCEALQRIIITRNEQVSGSSPLGGSTKTPQTAGKRRLSSSHAKIFVSNSSQSRASFIAVAVCFAEES
jgi:hypothetical protein